MTDENLTKLVQEVSQKYFCREFTNKAFFNTRLQTTGGRFHFNSENIDINPRILELYDEKVLVGVIKHELCHYHLYKQKIDGTHRSPQFKRLLKEVDGLRYVPALKERKYKIYVCKDCGVVYKRVKKINTRRFACGKCRGKLFLRKEIYSF